MQHPATNKTGSGGKKAPLDIPAPAVKMIHALCKQIEREKKIRILFCVENGSRAWGMSSKDSDFDCRFVFARPVQDYLQLDTPTDVIQCMFNDNGEHVSEGGYFDFAGFDVFKFCRMLSSSNPSTIEWLTGRICYVGKQNPVFRAFAEHSFNRTGLYFHYKSMCRQNYLKYLKSHEAVTYKKYLYCMRGLVNAKWVAVKKSLPPIVFTECFSQLAKEGVLPASIEHILLDIITKKKSGREKSIVQNIVQIDEYIENFLKNDDDAPREKQCATRRELNTELQRIVMNSNKKRKEC